MLGVSSSIWYLWKLSRKANPIPMSHMGSDNDMTWILYWSCKTISGTTYIRPCARMFALTVPYRWCCSATGGRKKMDIFQMSTGCIHRNNHTIKLKITTQHFDQCYSKCTHDTIRTHSYNINIMIIHQTPKYCSRLKNQPYRKKAKEYSTGFWK